MDVSMFKALVEVEPCELDKGAPLLPAAPAKAVPRTYPGAPQRDGLSIELSRINTNPNNGRTAADKTAAGIAGSPRAQSLSLSSPPTPGTDVEMSRPTSPAAFEVLQSISDPHMNRYRLAAACLMNFGSGLNDSAPGALIPYIEKHYNIGYAIVSLVFIGNAFGFIFGAVFLESLRVRLGRARLLALAQTIITLGYAPILAQAPFPLVVVSFFVIGFGISLNLAVNNVFCGSLRQATTALGFLHGAYGIGGIVGPLIATALVTAARTRWSMYYVIPLALAIFNGAFSAWSFRDYDSELVSGTSAAQESAAAADSGTQLLSMFSALKIRVVLLGALFIFAYQGAEVSISGWIISFLITVRGGDPDSVGYVTAGFWAGITVGRLCLSHPAHRVGEKLFVVLATVGAAVFQLLVWWVPNVVGPAVSVAIVGLLLGPIYPCAAAVFMRGMTRQKRPSGMGVISAFGSSGGAVAPFMTGILAQASGTWVLHPIAIGLFAVMMASWYGVPHSRKRSE
ncbi:major facilitator superfamily transporter [Colletotrichum graminicola]|uniref:Major facilitator superfamily transporter n=1 Tax=Colletotrichum graminicola (strain M1.001 / M2 / FGSC 10212) TaxID=645133 RepID=E3QV51_COLGM|nr:major facilitator superfamily transporter [Colletotrichum graminicola M1.001]EFQ34741.1 major facilitator superfamily transporter [Colletotrichum graminicola M1.001]WDK16894.1 major facilitator superfamily transporter [Colletotrichum graminicola]